MEDRPEDGSFLPSHVASDEEYLALAEVLGQFGVGHIGWTVGLGHTPEERERQRELLRQMVRLSGRPLHVAGMDEAAYAWLMSARAEGLPVVAQMGAVPTQAEFKLTEYNLFDYMPNWVQPLVGGLEERVVKLSDPRVRAAMKRDVEKYPHPRTDWNGMRVVEVAHERNYKYEGLTIAEVARMQGKHPLDAFLDLALDESLETEFTHSAGGPDEGEREDLIKSPYSHVSVSDGGAHTRFLTNSTWPVYFLTHWVRERETMSLEQAHYKISAFPAWFSDLKDRGTLRAGAWADVIVYDLEKLGFLHDKPIFDTDFPGGERRLVQKPTGLRYTIVNGAVTFEENRCTGALPGKLLRSYDMVG